MTVDQIIAEAAKKPVYNAVLYCCSNRHQGRDLATRYRTPREVDAGITAAIAYCDWRILHISDRRSSYALARKRLVDARILYPHRNRGQLVARDA